MNRIRASATAMIAFLACGGGGNGTGTDAIADARPDVFDSPDVAADVPDPGTGDPGGPVDPGFEDQAQQDVPKDTGGELTCASVLADWQCIGPDKCPDWESCLGVTSCDEPPCWGLCQDFPGQCLPRPLAKVCATDSDCPPGFACAAPSSTQNGICRGRPSDVACFGDQNCPTGQYCAGEVACPPGAYCVGPEFWGLCSTKPMAGACFDSADCGAKAHCEGQLLCPPGAPSCQAKAGTCVPGAAGTCADDAGCASSPAGKFCTGAHDCQGGECAFPAVPGFCSAPPGFKGCWEDSDCAPGQVCNSALACPPGTLCGQAFAHAGQCGDAPTEGGGVLINTDATSVKATQPFRVILVAQTPYALYLDPCVTFFLEKKGDGDTWTAINTGCATDQKILLRLGPGSGVVLPASAPKPGTYRIRAEYRVSCVQGSASGPCAPTPVLDARTLPFEVVQ
jgi:hypothetical protein